MIRPPPEKGDRFFDPGLGLLSLGGGDGVGVPVAGIVKQDLVVRRGSRIRSDSGHDGN